MTQPEESRAPAAGEVLPERPRLRPDWLRAVLATVLWIAAWAGPRMLGGFLWTDGEPLVDAGFLYLEGEDVCFLLTMAVYAVLARRVSYRWFDALFLLIPFYNLMWSARIVWRICFLPYRDWDPRPGEASDWVAVPPIGGYAPVYVRRPRTQYG
ncbi:MAG: hypothetical protein ACRDPJ_21555 [Nocardioidaceae bacterium]